MARKPKIKETQFPEINRTILSENSTDYLNKVSLDYSIYTLSRHIVGMDGLKSAQRKAIFAISKVPNKIKTMSLSGKMIEMGIYVHGDSSANDTLSNLASPVTNNYPLIMGHGSFGTCANPEPAAARYTYVEKSKNTTNLLLTDSDIILMKDNYDATTKEPVSYAPLIPLALLGTSGMSVGYKADILPRNIYDIIDNTINAIDGKPLKPMLPKFSSYGCNEKVDNPEESKFVVYGKAEVIDDSTVKVTGLPIKTSLEKFTLKLIEMEEKGLIKDYDDDSTDFVSITIKLPRGTSKGWTEMDVLEYFKLHYKMTEIITVLDENECVVVYQSPLDMFADYIQFRFSYYIKRYEKRLQESVDEFRYQLLVKECFENDIMTKVKNMKNMKEMVDFVQSLNNEIEADERYLTRIVNFPSYRWTQEYYDALTPIIDKLVEDIEYYQGLIDNPDKIWNIYRSELEELKKQKF